MFIATLLLILASLPAPQQLESNEQLYQRLDSALANREVYETAKENKLNVLKRSMSIVTNPEGKLQICYQLAREYEAYVFDSSEVYINKGLILAQKFANSEYIYKNQVMQAELMITRGYYSEAKSLLDSLEVTYPEKISDYLYNHARYILNNNLMSYSEGSKFNALYEQKRKYYLNKIVNTCPKNSIEHMYILGEYYNYIRNDKKRAAYYYKKTLDKAGPSKRVYAMAAYALASQYSTVPKIYEHYLLLAAISDAITPTKENMALQGLAFYLYQNKRDDLDKARHYINLSLNDAFSYNNRLRSSQIATKLPVIMNAHAKIIENMNTQLKVALLFILLLLISVFASSYKLKKKNRLLKQKQLELGQSNGMLSQLNEQLNGINHNLVGTNQKREKLVKVYIDLCATYIDRLNKFQTLVQRKIKSNQAKDLLSMLSSSRLTKEENNKFIIQFDQAFLVLYPTFVTEINRLLKPDCAFNVTESIGLTPALRVFALIRLGIKESSQIAGILGYSPQTVYNYRSNTKSNAIDKEHFEENVRELCTVMS